MIIINMGKPVNGVLLYEEIKATFPGILPKLSGVDDEDGEGVIRLKTGLTTQEATDLSAVISTHDSNAQTYQQRNEDILAQILEKEQEAMRGIIELNVEERTPGRVDPSDVADSRARVDTTYDELAALRALLT